MLLIFSLLSMGTLTTSAAGTAPDSLAEMSESFDVDGRVYKYLKGITNKNLWSYSRPTVSIGQKRLSVSGVVINGVYYIPFRSAASAISGSTYS